MIGRGWPFGRHLNTRRSFATAPAFPPTCRARAHQGLALDWIWADGETVIGQKYFQLGIGIRGTLQKTPMYYTTAVQYVYIPGKRNTWYQVLSKKTNADVFCDYGMRAPAVGGDTTHTSCLLFWPCCRCCSHRLAGSSASCSLRPRFFLGLSISIFTLKAAVP